MNAQHLIIGGIAATLAFIGINSSRLARFAQEFQLDVSARVHRVTLQSLTLAIDIVFKNPTDARLTLKHPTVYLYDRDPGQTKGLTPIITSRVENRTYRIEPNAETKLDPVYVELSFLNLSFLSNAYTLLKQYLAKKPVVLWVRCLTQVNNTVPVVKTEAITLNSPR